MNTPMKKRCTACTMEREEQEFVRKNKTYKTCNKCSEYHKRRNNPPNVNASNISASDLLERLFVEKKLSPRLEQKYKHIKSLEQMLLRDIWVENGFDKK